MAHTGDTPTGDAVNQTPHGGDAGPPGPQAGEAGASGPQADAGAAALPQTGGSPAVEPPEHASTDTSVGVYPEGYPHEWAADVLGSDGRAVRIRPILPTDAEKIG